MPAPHPVPRIAAKTTSAPAPAPSVASDSARQFASLASATGWPSADSMSLCSGRPLSQVELQFFIRPSAPAAPGVPRPTASGAPAAARACAASPAMAATVAS